MPAEVDGPTLRVVRDGRLSTAWFGCSGLRSIWTILNCGSFDATVQVTRRIWLPTIRSGRREWRREQHPRKCVRGPVQPVGPGPAEEVPQPCQPRIGSRQGRGHRASQTTANTSPSTTEACSSGAPIGAYRSRPAHSKVLHNKGVRAHTLRPRPKDTRRWVIRRR